ncbi:MAG: histone deacetylase family protein [Tepidamorphaceae bacterium]|nr:histone deacetylase family protein [Rhodobiaceae bacterium]MCC0047955.1 histone deacetylase family protein [Rhodobiaceae bacterium]
MKTFFSEKHRLHFPQAELSGGEFVTPFERPSRAEYILNRLRDRGFETPQAPGDVDMKPVLALHDAGYIDFLESAWEEWKAAGFRGEIIPTAFPARRMQARCPDHIDGKVGYYALACETAMTSGTWEAARSSCASAQSAQKHVASGARSAFALCRPPGHHAAIDMFGGYCFINNAAVVAQMFRDDGAARVAILDVDFHHGNGTQDIFYDRGDVFFASLHGKPEDAFPYFLGYADETGAGGGEGTTANYPMPPKTPYNAWSEALDDAIARIGKFGAEALVVSLGVDAFKEDPISFFKLESDDFTDCGRRIEKLGLPTVFCMEGGYAIEAVGINTVNVLEGFEGA